jgi:hypothetical protein
LLDWRRRVLAGAGEEEAHLAVCRMLSVLCFCCVFRELDLRVSSSCTSGMSDNKVYPGSERYRPRKRSDNGALS